MSDMTTHPLHKVFAYADSLSTQTLQDALRMAEATRSEQYLSEVLLAIRTVLLTRGAL